MMQKNKNTEDFKKFSKGFGITSTQFDDYHKQFQGMTPNIIEEKEKRGVVIDVFSRLMEDRTIFLGMPIDDQVANVVIAQLLYLESQDSKKDINIYVNSPGGGIYAGLGIYDTMQYVEPDIATTCVGLSASMGAVLLAAGEEGKRSSLPHSRIMIHQPLGGSEGQASDIEITAQQILTLKDELCQILADHTGQKKEKVVKDSDRDYWMRAEAAKEYGLIDNVINKNSK